MYLKKLDLETLLQIHNILICLNILLLNADVNLRS